MTMNPEIKKRWVESLRSGEYKQGIGCLRDGDHYCCLGVLCDLVKDEIGGTWEAINRRQYEFLGKDLSLPAEVRKLAGLTNPIGVFWKEGVRDTLTSQNDRGVPFTKIADIIEEHF